MVCDFFQNLKNFEEIKNSNLFDNNLKIFEEI